jgi:RNA polymerase sigma-70 factor (ECF subfamily)
VLRAIPPTVGDAEPDSPALDDESRAWVASLAPDHPDREPAIARLHELLLRAARFEAARRRAGLPDVGARELEDLVHQAADDALVAILAKLDSFRGDSRFTTWAYKFALLEAGVKLRRRAWRDRTVALDDEVHPAIADLRASPQADAEVAELLLAIRAAIDSELTPHQRDVLVAVTLNEVPIDVLAERLSTTRGALYKTLHDARRKLRSRLRDEGLPIGEDHEHRT